MQFLSRLVACASIACLVVFTACSGSSNSSSNSTQLRALNALSTTPSIDVSLDGSVFVQGLSYGGATSYASVTTGQHAIAVTQTGASLTLASTSLTVASSTSYTLLPSAQGGAISVVVLTDDLTAPSSGNFKLRLVNVAPSAGPMDVYVTSPGVTLTGLTPNVASLAVQAASSYLSLAAGSYEIRMTSPGTTNVLIDTGTISFGSQQIRTDVALDAVGGGVPLTSVVLADLN